MATNGVGSFSSLNMAINDRRTTTTHNSCFSNNSDSNVSTLKMRASLWQGKTYPCGDLGKVGRGTDCHIGNLSNEIVSSWDPRSWFLGSMRGGAMNLDPHWEQNLEYGRLLCLHRAHVSGLCSGTGCKWNR